MIVLDNEITNIETNEYVQSDLEMLQSKYDNMKKEVDDLESNKLSLNDSVKDIKDGFDLINKNVEVLMKKLDVIGKRVDESDEEANKENRRDYSFNNMVLSPLRKVAIGTIRVAITMGDKANEGVCNMREGIEDVVAEAQYLNKKQRIESTDQS